MKLKLLALSFTLLPALLTLMITIWSARCSSTTDIKENWILMRDYVNGFTFFIFLGVSLFYLVRKLQKHPLKNYLFILGGFILGMVFNSYSFLLLGFLVKTLV